MGDVSALARFLDGKRRILAFTGAGISTGSGIPDFRGPGGIWTTRKPVYFQEFLASEEKRREHWDFKAEGWDAFRHAAPNAAHRAITELQHRGVLLGVVTQNIDGLHQASGLEPERVVELHGTNRAIECLGCGALTDPEPAIRAFRQEGRAPRCGCGGFLKFATISFGQPLKESVLARASRLARECDAVLALGSTLSVHPAAAIPLVAAHLGVPYAIVNRGATEHDAIATLRIEGDVTEVLPAAVAAAS